MKKLIYKLIIIFILPYIVWTSCLTIFSYSIMDGEYPYWMQQKDTINKKDQKYEIIKIGDSVAKSSFRPNSIDNCDSVNLSLGGATSVEMYYTLINYLNNNQKPKLVIFSMNPFHYITQDCYKIRTLYFHYLSVSELIEVRQNAKAIDDVYWNEDGIDKTIVEYYLYDPGLYLPSVYNSADSLFVNRTVTNKELYKNLNDEKGWMTFKTNIGVSEYNEFNVNELIDLYLKKIINLCKDNDITLIIEQEPINESYKDCYSKDFIQEYNDYFEHLKNSYDDIIVNDQFVTLDSNYFEDASHLNENGANYYSQLIFDKYINLIN